MCTEQCVVLQGYFKYYKAIVCVYSGLVHSSHSAEEKAIVQSDCGYEWLCTCVIMSFTSSSDNVLKITLICTNAGLE